ncbi:hypothetical protein SAMN05880590_101115 [Rhizobium sp. RU35A]|uniref:hypothetical protein n=1 Tax=Rhizobium sp. RU35A TaxID=1907414 RepID=UPI00095750EE|nr:hypothetical protein [Rhizobium sp. RU35A]SIP90462.1 hypothetical protein SAMN05880590_101115 [Rhizobium sp. RU35A]
MTLPLWFEVVLACIYMLVALVFLGQAFLDRLASGERWTGLRVIGLVLCLVWPLTLLGVMVWAALGRFRRRHEDASVGIAPMRLNRRWRS